MKNNSILAYLQQTGKIIQAPCQGNGQCGKCKVRILNRMVSILEKEKIVLSKEELAQGYRLACMHRYHVEDKIEVPDVSGAILSTSILGQVSSAWNEAGYGIAVDIGTTTVVMQWFDLVSGTLVHSTSFYNPQASFGSDVISRISYDMNDEGYTLHDILINKMEEALCKCSLLSIKQMVVTGNTTMIHLFLKHKTTSLGRSPFTMVEPNSVTLPSKQIFPHFTINFLITTLPHISAFVGSDIVCGMVASNMDQCDATHMLIDLGTNGEIAIGNKHKMVTTSTAAGPAFEGVNIECGGPSIYGAIYDVRIQNNKISYQTIGNQDATCICGTGLVSIISELVRHGEIDEMGRFKDGRSRYYIDDTIYVSNKDIQAFQLAKAAMQAGITLLSKTCNTLDSIYIAGGFGTHLKVEDLITLKIIDEKYKDKVKCIQNSALSGAIIALLTKDIERYTHVRNISSSFNLAKHPDFDDVLVDSLYFL